MASDVRKKILGEVQSAAQEVVRERTEDEVAQIQIMDITRATAALLDANVEEETIEGLLCKYWDLRPSETHRFIREGEEERKI